MGFFSATDGTRLYYQDWGTGPALVFLHSWLLHSGAWEYQFHALAGASLRRVGARPAQPDFLMTVDTTPCAPEPGGVPQ